MKPLTAEEAAAEGLPSVLTPEEAAAEGLPGHPGPNPYAPGQTEAQRAQANTRRTGTLKDAAVSWADKAALGGGPQIAGAIAAGMANPFTESPVAAYEAVRDATAKEIKSSDETMWGGVGGSAGLLSTPVPGKALPKGAGPLAHAKRGAKIGGGMGAVHGAVNSDADLTRGGWEQYAELLKDTGVGGLGGGTAGFVVGGGLGALEKPARQTARRLPMDILGVGEPARRSMQRQGIYDEAGDELLKLVKPGRSGMRKASLTDDAVAELQKRGMSLDDAIAAVDKASGGKSVHPGSMAAEVLRGSMPSVKGSLHDKQVAKRMGAEAENVLSSLGDDAISLAEAEAFKQRFGPQVGKLLRHAGEPAARTTALGETHRALKRANEGGAELVNPALAEKFKRAKHDYSVLAAPIEGANIECSGMRSSDFDLGALLSDAPAPTSPLSKLAEGLPFAGLVKAPLDFAGRAYGRGAAAKALELFADKVAEGTMGGAVGTGGDVGASMAVDKLAPWLRFIGNDEEPKP